MLPRREPGNDRLAEIGSDAADGEESDLRAFVPWRAAGGALAPLRDEPQVKADYPRALTEREASILAELLSADIPDQAALRQQAEHVSAEGGCPCGCASIELAVDRSTGQPASRSWRPLPVELQAGDIDGGVPLEVILFVDDGWLSYLELVYYDRIPPRGFPPPEEFDVVVRWTS